jgi:dienelactone hydrolase
LGFLEADCWTKPQFKASILMLHGWKDRFAPPDDVLAIARELTEAKADWQLHCYGRSMHAFTFEGINLPEPGLGTTRMPVAARGMPCAPSSPKCLNDNPADWPV